MNEYFFKQKAAFHPKVAIIILNWNGWQDTIECLESLYQITYPNSEAFSVNALSKRDAKGCYDVIVVDNGSEDESIEKIKGYCEGKIKVESKFFNYSSENKPIKIIEYTREEAEAGGGKEGVIADFPSNGKLIFIKNEKNYGFAEGNNIGMRYALKALDPDYIWLLNNDTVVDEDALSEMIQLAESDHRLGMIGSRLLFYHKPYVIQAMGGKDKADWRFATLNMGGGKEDSKEWHRNIELKGYIIGASLLVRKAVIYTIGLMDENYFMFNEEVDWCTRAKKEKWGLFACGKSRVWHKAGMQYNPDKKIVKNFLGKPTVMYTMEGYSFRKYYETRNRIYFVKKNFPHYLVLHCLFILIPRIIYNIVEIMLYYDHKLERMGIIFKATLDGLIGKMGETIDAKQLL